MGEVEKILDCTLRDGGYHTNWSFSSSDVSSYLQALDRAQLCRIELGFRSLSTTEFRGKYYFTSDDVIAQAGSRFSGGLGVMIDAKEWSSLTDVESEINRTFQDCEKVRLDFVRVATTYANLTVALKLVAILKNKGYETFLNLMQISSLSQQDIAQITNLVSETADINYLILADSLGKITPDILRQLLERIELPKDMLGIHCHNNRGLALANTLVGLELGLGIVDSTLGGIGRGSGNCETENLYAMLVKSSDVHQARIRDDLIESSGRLISKIKKFSSWGYDPLHLYSAIHDVHPTYTHEVAASGFSQDRQWATIKSLAQRPEKFKFSSSAWIKTRDSDITSPQDKYGASDTPALRDFSRKELLEKINKKGSSSLNVVLVGRGPSVLDVSEDVLLFVNSPDFLILDTSFCFGGSTSIISVVSEKSALESIATPFSHITNAPTNTKINVNSELFTYNVVVDSKNAAVRVNEQKPQDSREFYHFSFVQSEQYFASGIGSGGPAENTAIYSLLTAMSFEPTKLLLVGFDGTENSISSHSATEGCLRWIAKRTKLQTLTPSRYNVSSMPIHRLLRDV